MCKKDKIKDGNKKLVEKVKKGGIINEFKEFISKGSVLNLAVGVIIGGAFQGIVNSLVNDILMPIISIFTKGIDFSEWFYVFGEEKYVSLQAAQDASAVVISYGNFIAAAINFLIMAVIIFFLVKFFNSLTTRKKSEEEPAKEPRLCNFCFMVVNDEAVRCPHCTSELELAKALPRSEEQA